MVRTFLVSVFCFCAVSSNAQKILSTDVLVIGGGTGGTAAGIQSARMGAKTLIVESTPWLGGMISAAGVSAIDGNHRLPSGLWAEFRNEIYKVYGGPKAVETGWVSNTLFEPHIADSIFKSLAIKEKSLKVFHNYSFHSLSKKRNKITRVRFINKINGQALIVKANVFIDATELGDVMKAAGVAYDLGMEADEISGEKVGITQTNNVVQDLTYAAILKDYGKGQDCTIAVPAGYDPKEFDGACTDYYNDKSRRAPTVNGKKMLEYGKLPRNKYMINWPAYGNDTYLNVVEMNETQRNLELVKAKETTLRFVYFIQKQLGFKNLGLANDEFPTKDHLALMPYYREGRRVKGLTRFTMRHIAEPFTFGDPLYRTGISVGDYPIDHHHGKNPSVAQHLDFYSIPSYNVPLGALIPKNFDNLIIAEKGISVSNVANGSTRLQPCVLLTGQAAGTMAALSSLKKEKPAEIPVRTVQNSLLQAKAYIMPYIDIMPTSPYFEAVQKIGATGILRGKGIPYRWANQTWFYPDSMVEAKSLCENLNEFKQAAYVFSGKHVLVSEAITIVEKIRPNFGAQGSNKTPKASAVIKSKWKNWGLTNFDPNRHITRLELAVLLQKTVDPFAMKAINHQGRFKE